MKTRKGIANVILLFGALLLFVSGSSSADTSVSHIFLVQNSGWMLPFYEDSDSKFKDLVIELADRVRPYGNPEQVISSFNQSLGDNKSPVLVYRGSDKSQIHAAVHSIQLARKPGRQSYADTDFKEAIIGAVTQFSPGVSCLLWIITNNKNSPDNSVETIERNKEFYRFLQDTQQIKRIVAFPHAMMVQSRTRSDYRANGLMIYAMAYGDPADQLLQRMLGANIPFGKQPARLKPLDAEALTFIPKEVKSNNVDASIADDRKTLVLNFAADSKPEVAELVGKFRNDFYPYDILSGEASIDVEGFKTIDGGEFTTELSTKKVKALEPGSFSSDVSVRIGLPSIPSPWDPEVIFGNGYTSKGVILFKLTDQKLGISKEFVEAMSKLFPRDPLPDLFVPGDSAKTSITRQALVVRVNYPGWPLMLLASLALLVAGGGIGAIIVLRREKIFRVSIDGVQKTFGLKPFSEVVLKDQQGTKIGMLKRGFGQAIPMLEKGRTNTVRVM